MVEYLLPCGRDSRTPANRTNRFCSSNASISESVERVSSFPPLMTLFRQEIACKSSLCSSQSAGVTLASSCSTCQTKLTIQEIDCWQHLSWREALESCTRAIAGDALVRTSRSKGYRVMRWKGFIKKLSRSCCLLSGKPFTTSQSCWKALERLMSLL